MKVVHITHVTVIFCKERLTDIWMSEYQLILQVICSVYVIGYLAFFISM
jgi:hypothetical protein